MTSRVAVTSSYTKSATSVLDARLDRTALAVFGLLRDGIARLQEAGVLGEGDTAPKAITAWTALHGLVVLSLDGPAAVTGRALDTLADAAIAVLLAGMGASVAASRPRRRNTRRSPARPRPRAKE